MKYIFGYSNIRVRILNIRISEIWLFEYIHFCIHSKLSLVKGEYSNIFGYSNICLRILDIRIRILEILLSECIRIHIRSKKLFCKGRIYNLFGYSNICLRILDIWIRILKIWLFEYIHIRIWSNLVFSKGRIYEYIRIFKYLSPNTGYANTNIRNLTFWIYSLSNSVQKSIFALLWSFTLKMFFQLILSLQLL